MSKKILGVLFDFGGTLLDYTPCISLVFSRVAKILGFEFSPDDPRIRDGIRRQQTAFVALKVPEAKLTRDHMHSLNRHVLDAMGIDYGHVPKDRLMKIINEEFDRSFELGENFQLYPGTQETLERLHLTGLKIGLLSNCPAWLGTPRRKVMEKLGILKYFDAIILSGEVGVSKPEREVFELALKAIGIEEARKVIHIGDSPYADVQGARNAGLIPVLFNPLSLYSIEDVITLKKMPDLLGMLQYRVSF